MSFSGKKWGLRRRTPLDVNKLRRREKKWIQMFENWRFFMDNKWLYPLKEEKLPIFRFEKVRDRCRKGIPPSIRGKAWKYLCGAVYHMEVSNNRHVFEVCFPVIDRNSAFRDAFEGRLMPDAQTTSTRT
jgi:hypothetical protein